MKAKCLLTLLLILTYQKYDKKKHKRISSDGTSTLELHAVSANANGKTNCLL